MPRSASDGGGGSSRLRNVFARSPLGVAFSPVDDAPAAVPMPNPTAAKEHSPKEHSPKQQSSWFSRAGEQRRPTPDLDPDAFKFPLWKRQRSKSHLGGNRPLSLSKLSLHLAAETAVLSPADAKEASDNTGGARPFEESAGRVLHHGEVQIAQSGWRKKLEYMVLTERQLFRFKNSRKAADRFPRIHPERAAKMRRPESTGSISSLFEGEQPSSGAESPTDLMTAPRRTDVGMPLSGVVAVQLVAESRGGIAVELVRQAQEFAHAASLIIWVERTGCQPHWLEGLGDVVRRLPQSTRDAFPPGLLALVRDAVGADMDHVTADDHSSMFLVHPRQSGDPSHSPLDELSKEPSGLVVLVIGKHKVHIVTVPKSHRVSTRSVHEISKLQATSHGIVNLTCISVGDRDDSFDLLFRHPQKPVKSFELASVHSHDIAHQLHHRLEALQPGWKRSPFVFKVPPALQAELVPDSDDVPSAETFSSSLEAHCVAFGVELKNIHYSIETDGADAPRFLLLPPTESADYSALELLAVLRSLRFNEFFVTMSFAHVSLDCLGEAFDYFGDDHVCMTPKMGSTILVTFEEMKHSSLLIQELTAVILNGTKLRRLDFTSSIRRIPSSVRQEQGDDKGCGVVEALYPLCVNRNTNIDWIALNGIHLAQIDFEFVIGMLAKRDCHLRAIEMSGCHLDTLSLRLLLGEFPTQRQTLEVIDISNNPGQFSPDISFGYAYSQCQAMRILNLSGLHVTAEPAPLIMPDVLFCWRLEELRLSKCRINESTLETLIDYLKHDSSKALRAIHLDSCQIGAEGAARLYTSVCEGPYANADRELHLDLSENHIHPLTPLIAALNHPHGPSSLALRLLEFDAAADLRALFSALATNTSLHTLDLSEALLDFRVDDDDAEEDEEDGDGVAAAISSALARNATLRTLDLSGADSRLESSSLGPAGVAGALRGLRANAGLRTLLLRSQRLGLRAANELADALRANATLRELRLERNAVPLAGLVALVDAVRENRALVLLEDLDDGKRAALRAVRAAVEAMSRADDGAPAADGRRRRWRRRRRCARGRRSGFVSMGLYHQQQPQPHREPRELPPGPDAAEATAIVAARWDAQLALLRRRLARNARLAAGGDAGSLGDGEGDGGAVGLAGSPEAPSDRGAVERAEAGAPVEGPEQQSPEEQTPQEQRHEKVGGEHLTAGDEADVGLAVAGLALEKDADGGAAQPAAQGANRAIAKDEAAND